MLKPGNIQRRVIAAVAFLMIASGVGALVSIGLREAAFYDNKSLADGYLYGVHGIFIIIPGLVGLFVVFGCGCCNKKSAYIMSMAFDIVGPVLYIISIIALGVLLDSDPRTQSLRCTYVEGDCRCTLRGTPIPDFTRDFANGCDRELTVFSCRTALFCMWAFGLLFTVIHLGLVARLSCVMKIEVVTNILMKPGNIQRGEIAVVAFLMIASGVGTFVSNGLRDAAFYDDMGSPYGYLRGLHGIFIIIPGFVGLFVVFGCGCCNTRFVYIMSMAFDIVGLVLYIIFIIIFELLFGQALLIGNFSCSSIDGDCRCTSNGMPAPDNTRNFANGCDRTNMFHASRTALFCMWAFGHLFTVIHLVLVARLSCKLRSETPGQVLSEPGQIDIPMDKQAPQGRAQVYVFSTSARTHQPYISSATQY